MSIKSLRISISSVIFVLFKFEYCSKNIHQILHEKIDISNIASKTANIACWLPSGSPYKLLLVEMDNSIVNVFDSAVLCVAPNCRTRNTWLWSQVISHTFCRTKYTVMHSIRCILRTFANIWEGAFVKKLTAKGSYYIGWKMVLKASISADVITSFSRKGFRKRSFLDASKCSENVSEHS